MSVEHPLVTLDSVNKKVPVAIIMRTQDKWWSNDLCICLIYARIMMLTVMKNTKNPVKFWFLKNFLSPSLTVFYYVFVAYFQIYEVCHTVHPFFMKCLIPLHAFLLLASTHFTFVLQGFSSSHGPRVWLWVWTCSVSLAPLVACSDRKAEDHMGVSR